MADTKNQKNVALQVFNGLKNTLAPAAVADQDLAVKLAVLATSIEVAATQAEAWGVVRQANVLALPILLDLAGKEIKNVSQKYPEMDISEMAFSWHEGATNSKPLPERVMAARRALQLANQASYEQREAVRQAKAQAEAEKAAREAARQQKLAEKPQRDAQRRARQLERSTPQSRPVGSAGGKGGQNFGGGHSRKAKANRRKNAKRQATAKR